MNGTSSARKYVAASLRPDGQTLDHVNRLVADILGRAGCPRCGRIAFLNIEFVVDPPAEIAKQGVASYHEAGFH